MYRSKLAIPPSTKKANLIRPQPPPTLIFGKMNDLAESTLLSCIDLWVEVKNDRRPNVYYLSAKNDNIGIPNP